VNFGGRNGFQESGIAFDVCSWRYAGFLSACPVAVQPAKGDLAMSDSLRSKKVAILVADGFEQVEMTEPRMALTDAGATTTLISPNRRRVQAMHHHEKGDVFDVDLPLDSAHADDFDALLLPGGVANPDVLRTNEKAVQFARNFFDAGKPVAAICHGPWLLVEADVVRGRQVTSWPSLKTDLRNAGADWVDREVVVDNGLITSRKPDDIPAFNRKLVEEIAEGVHAGQVA
jgi:protease I